MYVLGIDFETTGLDPKVDRVIEAGACLFDWDKGVPLVIYSKLVDPERDIPSEITKLTGICADQVEQFGVHESTALVEINSLMRRADYVMAHNAAFDRGFYDAACNRRNEPPHPGGWLCSRLDIVYPPEITTRQLKYLAAEAGFVNPWRHRAVFDVLTMLKIASRHQLEAIVARASDPVIYVQAIVSFDEKEQAKERGYRWFGPSKMWWREYKSLDFAAVKDALGFPTRILNESPE